MASKQHPWYWNFCKLLAAIIAVAAAGQTTLTHAAGRFPTPIQPLLAWEVAPDGAVYVLDAAQRIYELDADTLAPVRASSRLSPVMTDASADIAVARDRLFVTGAQSDGIQVFDRADLQSVATLPIDAAALAVDPRGRLIVVQREPLPQGEDLQRFNVVSIALDDLYAEPQPFGPSAAQPFGSLFDLVVDRQQNLLLVGYADTSGSHNRHYRTYKAYDLQSGAEVLLPIERQAASRAWRPVPTQAGWTAIAYHWQGFFPPQQRIYLLSRSDSPAAEENTGSAPTPEMTAATMEGISGALAAAPAGDWLYLLRPRDLWVLEQSGQGKFTLAATLPFVAAPPADVRISPGGDTLYLFGNGWLVALPSADLQSGGIASFGPLPDTWLSQTEILKQMARQYPAADQEHGDVSLVNLLPSGEWYRSADRGRTWQPLPGVQFPDDLGLDLLSVSPNLSEDQAIVARGRWDDGRRTTWRSLDAGADWSAWTPPIAFAAGTEDERMLFTAGIEGGEATPLPVEGSSENPAWSPGWTQLAFQNNQAGNWDIYRTPSSCAGGPATQAAAAAQCAAQRLTDSPGGDLLPAWSPDGRWIAFVSLRDGNPEIYVMAANGWGQTRLTYAPGGDWRPAWLPDSRHLVFTTDRYGSNDIVLMSLPFSLENMDGEPPLVPAVATPADERDPFVNGDGEMLFLSDANGVMQPHAVNLAAFVEAETTGREIAPSAGTAVFADVAAPIGHPSWLADGRVLFAMGGGIYAAAAYSEPQDFVELLPPAAAALHPAAGAPWSKPPLTAVINRPLESTRASSTP